MSSIEDTAGPNYELLQKLHVLIPDELGELVVCPLDQVMDAIMDGHDLEWILMNAAIDGIRVTPEAIAKVRRLNETGDADAYWKRSS